VVPPFHNALMGGCHPTPVRESTRPYMGSINPLYLEYACSGSRRMVEYLDR